MPTLDDLDLYYQNEYRPASVAVNVSPYDDTSDLNFRTLSQAECVRSLDITPRSIVDVGCGFGLLLGCLAKIFPQARLSGIEISEKCHAALSKLQIDQAHTTLEREGRNPFAEQFDLLVCSHVLEHSGNVPLFLSVCHSMVRPGGTVLLEVPNCEHEYGTDTPHLVFFTPKTLKQTIERYGFTVLKCQACGPSIDRWQPNGKERARNWIEDHFPLSLSLSLKLLWHSARSHRKHLEASADAACDGLKKLKEEAKDEAWFKYDQPGFKHSAIRCVALRKA